MSYAFVVEKLGGISYESHYNYKKMINRILLELYPDSIIINDFRWVRRQEFDTDEGDISIINKAIGNITLFNWLVKKFSLYTLQKLYDFVEKNKKELFHTKGSFFGEVILLLRNTNKRGLENERIAINYLDTFLKSKGYEFKLKQTSICSREDVIDGIDIIIYSNNKEYYVQVKPLRSYILDKDTYKVRSSGKIKIYEKIHYYIFINDSKCLLFANIGMKVKNGNVFISKMYLKN